MDDSSYLYLVIRNDDGFPIVISIYGGIEGAKKEQESLGGAPNGYFVWQANDIEEEVAYGY